MEGKGMEAERQKSSASGPAGLADSNGPKQLEKWEKAETRMMSPICASPSFPLSTTNLGRTGRSLRLPV